MYVKCLAGSIEVFRSGFVEQEGKGCSCKGDIGDLLSCLPTFTEEKSIRVAKEGGLLRQKIGGNWGNVYPLLPLTMPPSKPPFPRWTHDSFIFLKMLVNHHTCERAVCSDSRTTLMCPVSFASITALSFSAQMKKSNHAQGCI